MKKLLFYVVGAGIFIYLVLLPRVRQNLRFFWGNEYQIIIYIAIIVGFLAIANKKIKGYIKIPSYLVFLPIAFFPLARCYFSIPYIFCRVCPRPCPWGELRRITIPGFLLLNIDCRHWCFGMCPFGQIQDEQSKTCKKRICLPSWVKNIRYVFLIMVIFIVIMTYNRGQAGAFLNGVFYFVWPTVIVALIIFVLSFFIPRFFCNYICPIGSFSDLVLRSRILKECKRIFGNENTKKECKPKRVS